jgi:hypothetical protein
MTIERENTGDRKTVVAREWLCIHVSTASYVTVGAVIDATI